MLNSELLPPELPIDTRSWFEKSWGEGPFSFSETLGIVLASENPANTARQFHTQNLVTGERVPLRAFLSELQRPSKPTKGVSPLAEKLLERMSEPLCVK